MSKHNWKPGDVAASTEHGYRSIFAGSCHIAEHGRAGGACWHNESGFSDPPSSPRRPLVVIDPEDRERVTDLTRLIREQCEQWYEPGVPTGKDVRAALREFANFAEDEPEELPDGLVISEGGDLLNWRGENYTRQKVSPPTPPKPEEPTGIGAVVEDADGVRWMSWRSGLDVHSRPWQRLEMDTDEFRDYADIAAVTTHFEGVTE